MAAAARAVPASEALFTSASRLVSSLSQRRKLSSLLPPSRPSYYQQALRQDSFRRPPTPRRQTLSFASRAVEKMGTEKESGTNDDATGTWDGTGSQQDFMVRDQCLLVNENDELTGQDNKYNCHQFNKDNPTGLLHRAFSVFLFDSQNRLLLQQRAGDKITFPDVWTNTCCSHPLSGYTPSEIDSPEDVANGTTPGVKAAAVRKLQHELGIVPEQVPTEGFKFLTRLHYCADDSVTYGAGAPWGEHELDYILFIKADVDLKPNPEEVGDHRYVTQPELKAMMDPASGLLWSPWFRIIATNFLDKWWEDLDTTMATDKFVDVSTIHRLSV